MSGNSPLLQPNLNMRSVFPSVREATDTSPVTHVVDELACFAVVGDLSTFQKYIVPDSSLHAAPKRRNLGYSHAV